MVIQKAETIVLTYFFYAQGYVKKPYIRPNSLCLKFAARGDYEKNWGEFVQRQAHHWLVGRNTYPCNFTVKTRTFK